MPASPFAVTAAAVDIASKTVAQRVRAEMRLEAPTMAVALWPSLGAGARSAELTAIHPDGAVEPLLWLKNYRPQWPSAYVFREPLRLPAGTRLVLTAYYDNDSGAPVPVRPRIDVSAFTPSPRAATP